MLFNNREVRNFLCFYFSTVLQISFHTMQVSFTRCKHLLTTRLLTIVCVVLLAFFPGRHASAIKIRPDACTNAIGEVGTCMFVWECIKQEGRQLGSCVDRFLVGTCCALLDEEDNVVPGAESGPGGTILPNTPEKEFTEDKPAASSVQMTTVTLPSSSMTSVSISITDRIKNITTVLETSTSPKSTTSATTSSPNRVSTPDYSECGIPTPQPKMKVVGGTHAAFGDWPWQVSVRRTSFFGFASTHRCGGAILSRSWIATAGHCVDDLLKSQIRVRVGEFDFSSTKEPYPYQERTISKKLVHPKYNFFTYENDLALLKLDSPLQLQPHVKPICLPPANDTFVGRNATVTGWGRLSEGGTLPTILQEVQVPIISNEKCKSMFLKAGRHELIPEIFMCAGYEKGGRDSCQGDSGGPLQVKGDDGRWFLAGIISWGIGCAEPNMPGVCTRINKFTHWIRHSMS